MANFNQPNQKVHGNQFNADNINFGNVERSDLIAQLENIKNDIDKANKEKLLTNGLANEARAKISDAIENINSPTPQKNTILELLKQAQSVVKDGASVAWLIKSIAQLIETLSI